MKNLVRIIVFCFFSFMAHAVHAQNAVARPAAISINHIAVYVHELGPSTAFYKNVLQLQEIPEPFKDGLHTWFTLGPAGQLHLIQGAADVVKPNKNDHLCFSVASIEDFIANLDKQKIDYTNWPGTAKEPTVRVDGVKQIYFQDPDGHWIEVNNDTASRKN